MLSLSVWQPLDQPVFLHSSELAAQITPEPGDGSVAISTQITWPAGEGNVAVFRAEEVRGGSLTTYRVVDDAEHGYVRRVE